MGSQHYNNGPLRVKLTAMKLMLVDATDRLISGWMLWLSKCYVNSFDALSVLQFC